MQEETFLLLLFMFGSIVYFVKQWEKRGKSEDDALDKKPFRQTKWNENQINTVGKIHGARNTVDRFSNNLLQAQE